MRKYFFLIIGLSILPFIPLLLHGDLPHTHDGLVHLPRMAAFYKALTDGQFPVRWAGDLNYGYGMPLFNFVYHFPYYVSSILLFLGFGLVKAFIFTLLFSFLLSGICTLLFTKEFFKDQRIAFFVTIFYQFASFRFVELLIRGSFGEVYTYAFLPLLLYGLIRLFKRFSLATFLLAVAAAGLLIISHNSVSLLFFGVAGLFILFFSGTKKNVCIGLLVLFLGLLVSAYYWVPALSDHKYTYGNLFMKDVYLAHFVPLHQFIIPNFTNSKSLQTEGIATQFGLFQTIGSLLAIGILFQKKKKFSLQYKRIIVFGIVLLLLSLFFMQPLSKIVWQYIALLRQFQFPWRFLSIVVFATSLLSVSYFSFPFLKKKLVYSVIIVLTILTTMNFWIPNLGYDKVNESYYWNFPLNTTYYGETDIIWSAGPAKAYPKKRVEVINGEATIDNFVKHSNKQSFTIHAKEKSTLVSHTAYFPGWKVFVDSKEISEIQFQDPNHRGEIVFPVSAGKHTVTIAFTETKIRLLADIISLLSVLVLITLGMYVFVRRYTKKAL